MSLSVKVKSYKGNQPANPMSAIFDQQGGKMGRSTDNHLVLADPDKYISRKHAVISFENGFYYLTDTSSGGTFLSKQNRKLHGDTIQLVDGDMLKIGDYELLVKIASGNALETTSHSETDSEEDPSIFKLMQNQPARTGPELSGNEEFSWPDNGDVQQRPRPTPSNDLDHGQVIEESMVPPEFAASSETESEIPDNLGIEGFFEPSKISKKTVEPPPTSSNDDSSLLKKLDGLDRDIPEPCPEPISEPPRDEIEHTIEPQTQKSKIEKPAPRPTESDAELLNIFLEAAGIKKKDLYGNEEIPEFMRTVGAVFRDMLEGLMTILRGRTELKSQFRVTATLLTPSGSNPLKHTLTAEEAIRLMLIEKHPGYLNANEAVREGHEDIMNHQLAITAGVQASLISILRRFDPRQFADKYEEGLVFQKKAKCWEDYSQAYRDLVREAMENFFGDAFARAYEEQISKLRSARKRD